MLMNNSTAVKIGEKADFTPCQVSVVKVPEGFRAVLHFHTESHYCFKVRSSFVAAKRDAVKWLNLRG